MHRPFGLAPRSVLVVALLVFASTAHGFLPGRGSECTPPPDGLWESMTRVRIPGSRRPVVGVRTYIRLTQEVDNAYSGSGGGLAFFDTDGNPAAVELAFRVLAVLNLDTCTLSGTIYSLETGGVDAFYWEYNGVTLRGRVMTVVNGTLVFPELARMDLAYVE